MRHKTVPEEMMMMMMFVTIGDDDMDVKPRERQTMTMNLGKLPAANCLVHWTVIGSRPASSLQEAHPWCGHPHACAPVATQGEAPALMMAMIPRETKHHRMAAGC